MTICHGMGEGGASHPLLITGEATGFAGIKMGQGWLTFFFQARETL
jgi:hypothetical protein